MTGALAARSSFCGATFRRAYLLGTDLSDVSLKSANMTSARLAANLTGADLTGADLTRTRLQNATLVNTTSVGVFASELPIWTDEPTFEVALRRC